MVQEVTAGFTGLGQPQFREAMPSTEEAVAEVVATKTTRPPEAEQLAVVHCMVLAAVVVVLPTPVAV